MVLKESEYEEQKSIYEQDLLKETTNLIGYIYYNYWANEKDKVEFKEVIVNNSKYSV